MAGALEDIVAALRSMDPEAVGKIAEEAKQGTKSRIWVPNPGPQTTAFYSEADELFYGGSAGGGKTDLLMGLALEEHHRSLILRRTNKEAEKLPERMEEIVGGDAGLNRSTGTWRLGDRIIDMGGCQLEGDKQKRKGIPHDLKAFDEITDFTESQYRFIIAWNRSTKAGQRSRVVCTGNPPTTAEGYWVIAYWAPWLDPTHPNPAKPGELRWFTTDPVTGRDVEVDGRGPHLINGEEVYARSRTFIRAKLEDNPDLAATDYDSVLASLPERERLAYRDGRFDAAIQDQVGQAIPTAWVRAAQDRWTERPPKGIPMCSLGVDCTGGGNDPMVLVPRYDSWFDHPTVIPGSEFKMETLSQQAAGHVMIVRRDACPVIIDMGGGYGGGLYEHLTNNDVECVPYKGSEVSGARSRNEKMRFKNTRSEAIWRFREALDPSQPGGSDIALPSDPELVADLTSPTYDIVNNTIVVESKEKVVERLGRSTDKGDGTVMAWHRGKKMETDALELIEGQQSHRRRGQQPRVITARPLRSARGRR